jgi:putative nucleotidyltransferase with HDIG domain
MVLSRIEALETARLEAERHKAFLDLTLALEASREPLVMAQEALETLLRLTPYHGGALYLFQEGEVRPAVMAGRYPPDFPRLYEAHPIRFGEGLLGHPRLWERPVYVEDYARFPGALRPYAESGLRSALLVPLRPEGRRYGILALGSFGEAIPYRQEDEAALKMVARRLEESLERLFQLERLRLTREAALKALSRVLEYRDLETKGHTERVAELALRLGQALGFPDLEGLRLGAYFHDLGKLALPDEILKKPAALSTGEWRLVKTHPEVGLEILQSLPFLPQDGPERGPLPPRALGRLRLPQGAQGGGDPPRGPHLCRGGRVGRPHLPKALQGGLAGGPGPGGAPGPSGEGPGPRGGGGLPGNHLGAHSTVTLLARFRGWSTSRPRRRAVS